MGIYINPKENILTFKEKCLWVESKDGEVFGLGGMPFDRDFVLKNGHKSIVESFTYNGKTEDHILTIVVDNGPFAAIGVMTDTGEIKAALTNKSRPFKAYHLAKSVILDNIPDSYGETVKGLTKYIGS